MPLAYLLVEGDVDTSIFTEIFQGSPPCKPGGSKETLAPQVRRCREPDEHKDKDESTGDHKRTLKKGVMAAYLRDRDFDFEPPPDLDQPTIDVAAKSEGEPPLGWRLNRHSIESYLLDPRVVGATFNVPEADWEHLICTAGKDIAAYQAGRWTIAQLRSGLPRPFKLQTSAISKGDFALPKSRSQTDVETWCRQTVSTFRRTVEDALSDEALTIAFGNRCQQFSDDFCSDSRQILVWFSGKDLFTAVKQLPELPQQIKQHSCDKLREKLRDWVIANIDQFLSWFPELSALKEKLNA